MKLNSYVELLVVISLVVLGAATYQRNLVWKDNCSLWSDVVEKSPGKFRGHNNLGNVYAGLEQYDRAMAEFKYTLALNPQADKAHNNMGNVYLARDQIDQAMAEYKAISDILK